MDKNQAMIYKNKTPLLFFLIPAFIFMAVYLFYPFFMNIYNSFTEIEGLGSAAVGTQSPFYANYVRMFQDPKLLTSLKNTLVLMLCTIVFQVGIALILALLVDNIKVGSQFFRTVYFFPIVVSATALGLLFNLIFNFNGGMLNQIVALFRPDLVGQNAINWKESYWQLTLLSPVMWQYIGFYFVILVTGLNNIPTDIYEAADIDGASPLQQVFRIKLPMLHNTLVTCLVLAITGSLKVFDLPWTMLKNGIPLDKSWLTGTYMYSRTMLAGDVDYGSTIAVLIVVLGIVISQLANAFFKERDY